METAIQEEELLFIEDYLDPIRKPSVFLSDFFHDEFWLNRDYQEDMILDNGKQVAIRCARGVGKSESLKQILIDIILDPENYNKEGLLTTPNQAHLETIWGGIERAFLGDKYLTTLISKQYGGKSVRSPDYLMEFSNGFRLHGRIASASKGINLYGLHVDYVLIDEAELFGEDETNQLQGCLNSGATIILAGIPLGIQTSYLYKAAHDDEFSSHEINKFKDPTFTQKEHEKLIKIYGGKQSQTYLNQILALEGNPARRTFPPEYFRQCLYKKANYKSFELGQKDIEKFSFMELPSIPKSDGRVNLGIDCGYSPDPTEMLFFDGDNNLFLRIHLNAVKYPTQAELFHDIATYYNVDRMSIDNGHAGKAVVQYMQEYKDVCYTVIPVEFGGSIVVGVKKDPKTGKKVEIKERIKPYSTTLLRQEFENKDIGIPMNEYKVIMEVENSTCSTGRGGQMVFSEPEDHCLSAMRCHVIGPKLLPHETKKKTVGLAMVNI